MKNAKLVMGIYALAAVIAMLGIGVSLSFAWLTGGGYPAAGYIGAVVCLIATCFIFMVAFKTKRKFREQGLL